MDLNKFYYEAVIHFTKNKPRFRIGQSMFNHLSTIRPDLAEKVRGTDMDPFHVPDNEIENHPIWERFKAFLEENW